MKKSEMIVIKEFYEELNEASAYYLKISKSTSINSDEHKKAMNDLSSICEKMEVIRDLCARMGYYMSEILEK